MVKVSCYKINYVFYLEVKEKISKFALEFSSPLC